MSKAASAAIGVLCVVGGAGYYAYEEMGWFKAKPKPPEEPAHRKPGPAPKPDEVARKKEHTVPDLLDLDVEAARKAVAAAGFPSDALVEKDAACQYTNDRDMKPIGSICLQSPNAGVTVSGLTKIQVAVEVDTFEHGAVGRSNEWRRMPDVVGESLAGARAILAEKGFGADEFEVDGRSDCQRGTVCATRPEPGQRKVKAQTGTLYVP